MDEKGSYKQPFLFLTFSPNCIHLFINWLFRMLRYNGGTKSRFWGSFGLKTGIINPA